MRQGPLEPQILTSICKHNMAMTSSLSWLYDYLLVLEKKENVITSPKHS